MNQIQIITDAGSDIVDCSRTDLTVLPMTIRFGDEEYLDGVNLTHRQFYEKMIETQVLPTTSQPSPYAFEAAIRKVHEQGDIALIITISSKLSGTWQSANIAAAETGGEVYIVDSLNVAVGEKAIVEYALRMKDAGTDIHTIVETLNHEKENLRVIALLDTLEYLQKGGRISKTVAIAGSLLSACPVKAISHITGGGFYENIPRMMTDGLTAKIEKAAVPVLPVFEVMAKTGNIPERDMFNTFNMGVGMCVAVDKNDVHKAVAAIEAAGEKAVVLGEIVSGDEGVILC